MTACYANPTSTKVEIFGATTDHGWGATYIKGIIVGF